MKNLKVTAIVVSTIMAMFISCFLAKSEDSSDDEYFIFKEYETYKPRKFGGSCNEAKEDASSKGRIKKCAITYDGVPSKHHIVPRILITIDIYIDNEKAKEGLIRDRLSFYHKIHEMSDLKKQAGNDVLYRPIKNTDKRNQAYWVSNDKFIIIYAGHKNKIPAKMLKDYLAKYPPTHTFKLSDFDEQAFIKREIEKHFEKIYELEEGRGGFNFTTKAKLEEYYTIRKQCEKEMLIRCLMGMTDEDGKVDCPATAIMDEGDRKKAWKELKAKATKKNMVPENMVWRVPVMHAISCDKTDAYERDRKFIELLDIDVDKLFKE